MRADRADHDEREARIPRAGDVEESDHLARLRHAGDAEPDGEEHAGDEGDDAFTYERCTFHRAAPTTWRTTKTVITAVAMKTNVAITDRVEKRLIPHTP